MSRRPNTPEGITGPGAAPPYPQVVFSGGGTRCFWHGGFMSVAARTLVPHPERITGVSGGALSAASFVCGCEEKLLDEMTDVFRQQDRNFTWTDMLDGGGRTPHQALYREVVERVLGGEEATRAVAEGPQFQILLAHPAGDRDGPLAGALSAVAYLMEMKVTSSPHHDWAERLGVTTSLADANRAARDGKLVDLVCAAASVPVVFDNADWEGRPVIDGGVAEHAPMPCPDVGPTLILATRSYRNWPEEEGRTYLGPSRETDADRIDFTDPDKIRKTWDHGAADARAYLDILQDRNAETKTNT